MNRYLNMKKIARAPRRLASLVRDGVAFTTTPKSIPLVYFDSVKNVGDLISPYLVQRITNRKTHRPHTAVMPRLLGVGSIFSSATRNAYVWGSGLMSPEHARFEISPERVSAIRGKRTRDFLHKSYDLKKDLALGDPALLMPMFYNPVPPAIKDEKIGIIPHYVDFELAKRMTSEMGAAITLINVQQEPESFIDELISCTVVMSSSLHGLILADTYQVPNAWIAMSNNISGGSWKFHDYYTTTDNEGPRMFCIRSASDIYDLIVANETPFQVSRFQEKLSDLYGSFPSRFLDQ